MNGKVADQFFMEGRSKLDKTKKMDRQSRKEITSPGGGEYTRTVAVSCFRMFLNVFL